MPGAGGIAARSVASVSILPPAFILYLCKGAEAQQALCMIFGIKKDHALISFLQ